MFSVAGAFLIASGFVGMGLCAVRGLYARVRLLTAWLRLVERLEREISFSLSPLPELGGLMQDPCLKGFADRLKALYRPFGEIAFADAWREAALDLDLKLSDRELIASVGQILGRYDADNQARGLAHLRDGLEEALNTAKLSRAANARLYGVLGVVCGVVTVVLFAL